MQLLLALAVIGCCSGLGFPRGYCDCCDIARCGCGCGYESTVDVVNVCIVLAQVVLNVVADGFLKMLLERLLRLHALFLLMLLFDLLFTMPGMVVLLQLHSRDWS